MGVVKKTVGTLEKCYSLSLLEVQGETHFLVAAEKVNQCRLYDLEGNLKDIIWDEPGGVMTMVPVPGGKGQFLATQRFYSPNDSREAALVSVTPEHGLWTVRTLAGLPFVHRFDLLRRGGKTYLIACTLKSGHSYKNDWSSPGKVYAAELPEDLTAYDTGHPLKLTVLKEGMNKNHGYFHHQTADGDEALVACEQGVFRFIPPEREGENWQILQLLHVPASDAALVDFDGSGEKYMLVFSPFHGDRLALYKPVKGRYELVYEHGEELPFLHAVYVGRYGGRPAVFVGYRKGRRELLAVTMNDRGEVCIDVLDKDCGPANVLYFEKEGKDYLVSANRETDEIALYCL